jgi:hypothetical protein
MQVKTSLDATGLRVQGVDVALTTDVEYSNAEPTPSTIGGIPAGSTFTDVPVTTMLTNLLYPYQAPAFSAFAISGQTSPLEVGAAIAANRTFTWSTTNSSNIQANSIVIRDVTGSADIATGLANDGTEATVYAAISKTSATTHSFSITGSNSQAGTFTRSYSVSWQWRRFYGESTSTPLAEADIEALRVGGLASGFAGTYTFVGGGYKYLAYPAALGTATVFKDQSNNLPVAMEAPYTVSVTNAFGVTTPYNVHRTTNILGGSITIVVT